MSDIGGQRPKRKHWFQYFFPEHDINGSLFSPSEFDQNAYGRHTGQSPTETIINSQVVSNVSIILFLDKTNMLEEKVQMVSTKNYFLESEGDPHCLRDIQKFLVGCCCDKCRHQQLKRL